MLGAPTETVTIWHPVAPAERDEYGNARPATYDEEHSEAVGGAVVGDVAWESEASERAPDAIAETVAVYLPKGVAVPTVGCMVTVRGVDYLVSEGHVYDERGVPGQHNAWVKAVRRVGQ